MISNHPIELTLAFTPKNVILEQVMKKAARSLGTDVRIKGFNDTKSMYNVLITNNYLAGVEFGDDLKVSWIQLILLVLVNFKATCFRIFRNYQTNYRSPYAIPVKCAQPSYQELSFGQIGGLFWYFHPSKPMVLEQ